MIVLLLLIATVAVATYVITTRPNFGKTPSGERLERIKKSPHWKNGSFQNLSETPQLAEDTNTLSIFWRFLFGKPERKIPVKAFHFEKTDLKNLNPAQDVFVWMGHSSYYMQIDGKKILVDPVFSGYASPFSFTGHAFSGTDLYTTEDIPELDYLIITHDHWDHLDYNTVPKLFPKAKKIITGLGTGEHLEYWGYNPKNLIELDWFESSDLGNEFRVTAEPARHFSGRGLKRNQAIWASFMFETPTQKIYIGGDSGYDDYFKKIGEKYDSVDLAILENGQYNKDWRYIHFLPGENIKAMKDMNAKRMIPIHSGKFALAIHPWDEPLKIITEENTENLRIITPKIGENVDWKNDDIVYEKWWEAYD